MAQEIVLHFEKLKNIALEFYNDNINIQQPSLIIPIEAEQVIIKRIDVDDEEICYITNATSCDIRDNNDNNIYRTVYLSPKRKVRIVPDELTTIIEIY